MGKHLRWYIDEKLGVKHQVVRARPTLLSSGCPGMRVELKVKPGISDLVQPRFLLLTEAEYNAKVVLLPKPLA